MIVGGWQYVWAAYGIAWAGLLLYSMSLYGRRRAQHRSEEPHR